MAGKDYEGCTPLTEAVRGVKPKTAADFPGKHGPTAHQDARPHRVPEPSQEERLRGSSPWGKSFKRERY